MAKIPVRRAITYGKYFFDFYNNLDSKVQLKIDWTIQLIETLDNVPIKYFKFIPGTKGLYEIRIEYGSNIYRVFSFFDRDKLIIIINGFQKKDQKIPKGLIEKALKIKNQYFHEKE